MNKHPIIEVAQHCLRFVRTYGIRTTLREAGPYLREVISGREERAESLEAFDSQFGTDTQTMVDPWELPSLASKRQAEINGYQPTLAAMVREALRQIPFEPGTFTFVDLGSGKGRVLLIASEFAFKKIVGVEIAAELNQIAERNIDLYKPASQLCHDFDLQVKDVVDYHFPSGPMIVFMYNPFSGKTMARLLEKLETSLRQTLRQAFIIYVEPRFDRLLLKSSFMRTMIRAPGYAIYEARLSC